MPEKVKLQSSEKPKRRKKRNKKSKWSFKLPPDVRLSLQKEFPEIKKIDRVVNAVFEKILTKTTQDGACTITRFGSFIAYKSHSRRKGKTVPRFKFSPSRIMLHDIQNDSYIMRQIPEYGQSPKVNLAETFVDSDQSGGMARREADQINRTIAKQKTAERMAQDEIASILDESFDEEVV